jgi:hypothetical protein
MTTVSSLNTLSGALAITSGNPFIVVGTAGTSNVQVAYQNAGLGGVSVGADQFTTGIVGLVAGSGMTLTADTFNNNIILISNRIS